MYETTYHRASSAADAAAKISGGKLAVDRIQVRIDPMSEWRQIFDEWTLADLTGNTLPQRGVTQGIYCCPRWIPFVDLVAGNALAIDLLPAKRGHVGQVIAFGADHDQILCVAPDLEAFLDLCLSYQPGRGPLADVFG